MEKFYKNILLWVFSVAVILAVGFLFLEPKFFLEKNNPQQKFSAQKNLPPPPPQPVAVKVPILIYHGVRNYKATDSKNDRTYIVPPKNFEEQMAYLSKEKFTAITMNDLVKAIKGESSLPEKPIAITFDDGVINQYENAWPILKKYNLKATFYIFANAPNRNDHYFDFAKLKELVAAGMEIGSHTYFHQDLKKMDPDKLNFELAESKKRLEENLGITITDLAYPFGSFDDNVIAATKAAGYQSARTIFNGKEHAIDDLYKLRGYIITDDFARFKEIVK